MPDEGGAWAHELSSLYSRRRLSPLPRAGPSFSVGPLASCRGSAIYSMGREKKRSLRCGPGTAGFFSSISAAGSALSHAAVPFPRAYFYEGWRRSARYWLGESVRPDLQNL